MITNKPKSQKTTEIYFDETSAPVVIRTHNTNLKKRLLAFAEKFPNLCRLTDDDELGYLSFEIDKERFSIRLTSPYTEVWELLGKGKQPFLQCGVVRPYHDGRGCFIKIDFCCFLAFRFVGYHSFFS